MVKDALLHIKRCPFALQKGIFYFIKEHRLKCLWEDFLQKKGISQELEG